MKKWILFVCLISISALAFGGDKTIFELKDARNDDRGDGTLILPSDTDYRFGQFDMVSFSATAQEDGTLFKVEFAQSIPQPDTTAIDAGGTTLQSVMRYGFYTFNIDIYIDKDREPNSGYTATLPGRIATIDSNFAWEKMICVNPRPAYAGGVLKKLIVKNLEDKLEAEKGRVDPEDTAKISANASSDLEGSYFFPERVRVAGRSITFFVPSYFLGGTADPKWAYVIVETMASLQDSYPIGNFGGAAMGVTFMNLPVGEGSWSDRLGTTRRDAKFVPPILDMFVPPGMKQEEILRNFNVNTKTLVVLPGVVPQP
jgi:hypothetical protein